MYSAYVLLNANFKKIMMKIHLSVRYVVDAMWFAYQSIYSMTCGTRIEGKILIMKLRG